MMIRVDKFFIEELQKNGYDVDYKKLVEIYKSSRKNPEYIDRKVRNMRDNMLLDEIAKNFID